MNPRISRCNEQWSVIDRVVAVLHYAFLIAGLYNNKIEQIIISQRIIYIKFKVTTLTLYLKFLNIYMYTWNISLLVYEKI